MTAEEKRVIVQNIEWCINRVRKERRDYDVAADDVCNKLAFLADWIRELPLDEEKLACRNVRT